MPSPSPARPVWRPCSCCARCPRSAAGTRSFELPMSARVMDIDFALAERQPFVRYILARCHRVRAAVARRGRWRRRDCPARRERIGDDRRRPSRSAVRSMTVDRLAHVLVERLLRASRLSAASRLSLREQQIAAGDEGARRSRAPASSAIRLEVGHLQLAPADVHRPQQRNIGWSCRVQQPRRLRPRLVGDRRARQHARDLLAPLVVARACGRVVRVPSAPWLFSIR